MSHNLAIRPQSDDAEATMRRNLGLNTVSSQSSIPSSPSDALKAARQAIRSQTVARDYAERQLAHAEATIQDLRTKLHHARREKDTAVEAARLAAAIRMTAQRTLAATETALVAEKTTRDRGDRALREAQVTMRDLQGRLDVAAQNLEVTKAELTAERQERRKAEDELREAAFIQQSPEPIVTPTVVDVDQWSAATVITKRRRGRPSCSIEIVAPVMELDRSRSFARVATPVVRDEMVDTVVRSPVGRPRKTASTHSAQTSTMSAGKTVVPGKTVNRKVGPPKAKGRSQSADSQEPVKWWIEGWNG
jgi:hypothetical protein